MWQYWNEWLFWFAQIQFGKSHLQKWVLTLFIVAVLIRVGGELRRFLWRRKNFRNARLIKSISHWPKWWREIPRFTAFVLGLAFAGLLVLEPINKTVDQKPIREPALIAIGLDDSLSMLARANQDSNKSRLDLAKEHLESLIAVLTKEGASDKVMFFTFADDPYQELKDFTDDYPRIFLPALDSVEDFYVRAFGYGTDLAKVLDFCTKIFPKSELRKICVVITDGELEGKDLKKLDEDFQESLKNWRGVGRGIKLYFVAAGGGSRPEKIPRLNTFGNPTNEYEADDNGKDIETLARPDYLRKAATRAGAGFIHLPSGNIEETPLAGLIEKDKKIIGWKKTEKIADVSENFIKAYLFVLLLIFLLL